MLALNLFLLRKYSRIFNGRKIIFAVEEEGLVDQLHLTWMFNDTHDIRPYELIMVPKGQDACLPKMLESVRSTDPNEITFYAHAKDTSLEVLRHKSIDELSLWTEEIYRDNLEDPDHVDEILRKYPCAGTFKRRDFHHPEVWSYKDNFFWFNHEQLFRADWSGITTGLTADNYICRQFTYDQSYNFRIEKSDRTRCMNPITNWDPSKVTLVTTCKNRWEFLNNSLPTWLNKGFKRIIIVDWSSDIEVAGHLEHMPVGSTPVTVVRVEGETIFNGGMARNIGALQVRGEYAMFIDSDMVIKDMSQAHVISLVHDRFYHGPHNIPPFGTSLVRMEDFWNVNGYSELYLSYGWEDNDLYNRLEASGLRRCFYDERMVEHIDHDDSLRAQYRDQRGRKLHETIWHNRDEVEAWTSNHKRAEKQFSVKEYML